MVLTQQMSSETDRCYTSTLCTRRAAVTALRIWIKLLNKTH